MIDLLDARSARLLSPANLANMVEAMASLARAAAIIGQAIHAQEHGIGRPPWPVGQAMDDDPGARVVLVGDVVRIIAFHMGLKPAAICGPDRTSPLVRARDAIAWVARRVSGHSLTQIGLVLGGRDHSTILSALARAERRRAADPAFRMVTDRVAAQFEQEQDDGRDSAQIA